MTFLAFKQADLPVGRGTELNFAEANRAILDQYYSISDKFAFYFSPFRTSGTGWVSKQHPRTTLQRIAKDTFADAFIHDAGTQSWGWKIDYVTALRTHLRAPIPAFDLAAWLFRSESTEEDPTRLVELLRTRFRLTKNELTNLFDPQPTVESDWLVSEPVSTRELLGAIGPPPGTPPESGAALDHVRITGVGPASRLQYEPRNRLNVITGDNSLGKTFLLEAIWSALTNEWQACALVPRNESTKATPAIEYGVTARTTEVKVSVARYEWSKQTWQGPKAAAALPGLAIFARYDGSFAVWDPARAPEADGGRDPNRTEQIVFGKSEIWDGLDVEIHGRKRVISNGLVRDWIAWQTGSGRNAELFKSLRACLKGLSPSEDEILTPGEPKRIPFDGREFPTIRMPYGDVPIVHASAGIQRIAALAYFFVWAWHEHLENSRMSRREPQRRIILLIDEIEAHLHPRWQRVIIPAIISTVEAMRDAAQPQLHLATHSPMVLASMETLFDEETDALFHLALSGGEVRMEELNFVKRGRVDQWLMSEVFGLRQARSLPAEQAIERAKELQLSGNASFAEIELVHQQLQRSLAQDDDFWPRWLFWAEQRGVGI
jgi:hypothetical protein